MLADQTYGGHASIHDEASASALGLTGAPIEGPTHFSQFDPLAFRLWGQEWFERGCISAHFTKMVVEGEEVIASATQTGELSATIEAHKIDGTPVLVGSASIGDASETELDGRLQRLGPPGELFIVDRLFVGDKSEPVRSMVDMDSSNTELYPFSLRQKLDSITETNPWYSSSDNPWGAAILPFEMASVLSGKAGGQFPVRGPALGLFLDLEVRMVAGPLLVGHEYVLEREVVGLSQSRRTESHWVRTSVLDPTTRTLVATVLLHSGVFKDSYAEYPADRL